MSLSHRQARRFINLAADGLLNDDDRAALERHLATCDECRAQAVEVSRLEAQLTRALQARWPASRPARGDLDRLVSQVQARAGFRRLFERMFHSAQMLAWAGIAVAAILTVNWIFSGVSPATVEPATRAVEDVTVHMRFLYKPDTLNGEGLRAYRPLPRATRLGETGAVNDRRQLPAGEPLEDNTLQVGPGSRQYVMLVYDNPSGEIAELWLYEFVVAPEDMAQAIEIANYCGVSRLQLTSETHDAQDSLLQEAVEFRPMLREPASSVYDASINTRTYCGAYRLRVPPRQTGYLVIFMTIAAGTPPGSELELIWTVNSEPVY